MEQNNQNQFSDLSNFVENELQKGSLFLFNQIKNYNTLDKKISSIASLNLKDEKIYPQIINGILNGMLYDNNMSLENYFQILYSINHDSFKTFISKLADVITASNLKKEKYDKIYQIFEKLIKINLEKDYLVQILIIISRKFYPGQELLNIIINNENENDIINNENDNDDNININLFVQNNTFYKFLNFIKNNLEFILDAKKEINLPGIIFIKILRLLTETHIYQNKYNLTSNENINEKNSAIITNIVETYQKINFSEKIKKLISEIYETQIYILTKIYTEKKQEIFSIGRELIRNLISIWNSNIEIINTIKTDISSNYENILSISNSIDGYNIFTTINIPPIMERKLAFILTGVKKNSSTYSYYINWLFREYKIENSIGNTLLVDITRFIMTNNYYYMKYQYDEDYIPRWLILGYLLKHIKNHIISSEIKQTIFLDLILFDKIKDNYYLIEPCLSCIIINLKEFPAISEELIEFLEHYVKHFDNKNVQKRINSICDAFQIFEQRGRNNNDFDKLIRNSKMEEKFKNSFINLIKNEIWLKENKINNNNNINNINNNMINRNQEDINPNKNNNNQKDEKKMNIESNSQIDDNKTDSTNISNSNKNQNQEISKNSHKTKTPQKKDKAKEIPKKINLELIVPKELTTYVQLSTLKNFIIEKTQKRFGIFLNELTKYNTKEFGNIDNSIKSLDASYKDFCLNFSKFYIKIFKDELEIKAFESYENYNYNNNNNIYLYSYLFDYAFEKIKDNVTFQFIADLINKTIEVYPLLILHLISFIINNNFLANREKLNNDYINFFFALFNNEPKQIKEKLNLFFEKCEENFLSYPLKSFFFRCGVDFFNKYFFDDDHLILKIINNCDLVDINSINFALIEKKYILIDKIFGVLFKYSIILSPLSKHIFWNLVFSQGRIPSYNLEQFLIDCIKNLKNPPTKNNETPKINLEEFFGNVINSIKILFKTEILNDIKNGDNGLDSLSGKISHIFEFDTILKNYVFILLDNFLDFYFENKLRKKMFALIIQKYYALNCKNIQNLRIMIEFVYHFRLENKRRYTGDKIENNWFSEDIKTIVNEITKIINSYNNPEKHN